MNFKKGDRVYFEAYYGTKIGTVKGTGIIVDIRHKDVFVTADNSLPGLARVVVNPHLPGEILIPESVCNSELWKALS